MKGKGTQRRAFEWVAFNDEPTFTEVEDVASMVSVHLIADLFDLTALSVAKSVMKIRAEANQGVERYQLTFRVELPNWTPGGAHDQHILTVRASSLEEAETLGREKTLSEFTGRRQFPPEDIGEMELIEWRTY